MTTNTFRSNRTSTLSTSWPDSYGDFSVKALHWFFSVMSAEGLEELDFLLRSKAVPLCLGRWRPADSYPVGRAAPNHDALCVRANWGTKEAGPILAAAFCSHSPARHSAHLGRLQASAPIISRLVAHTSFLFAPGGLTPLRGGRHQGSRRSRRTATGPPEACGPAPPP